MKSVHTPQGTLPDLHHQHLRIMERHILIPMLQTTPPAARCSHIYAISVGHAAGSLQCFRIVPDNAVRHQTLHFACYQHCRYLCGARTGIRK